MSQKFGVNPLDGFRENDVYGRTDDGRPHHDSSRAKNPKKKPSAKTIRHLVLRTGCLLTSGSTKVLTNHKWVPFSCLFAFFRYLWECIAYSQGWDEMQFLNQIQIFCIGSNQKVCQKCQTHMKLDSRLLCNAREASRLAIRYYILIRTLELTLQGQPRSNVMVQL